MGVPAVHVGGCLFCAHLELPGERCRHPSAAPPRRWDVVRGRGEACGPAGALWEPREGATNLRGECARA